MDITVLQHHLDLLQLAIYYLKKKRKRKQRKRRVRWVKSWIGRRRQFGLYDQLMVELRNEDQRAFKNFLHMPREIYDELLERVGPRIAKRHTSCRAPLEPGLKLALTLRHLASESSYMSIRYGWRVPHNTQSVIVRGVCQAIVDEYLPEVMNCPTTPRLYLTLPRNCNHISFTKLPWPGDSEGTFRSSSQAATCPPVYHTRRRLHTVPLIAERQVGKL